MLTNQTFVNGFEEPYYFEMMGYIAIGNLNIRIHWDITGEMWFGMGTNH